jgi:hypothetical protein
MHRIIYFILIFLCGACTGNNDQRKKLETELRLFKRKAITLPGNMIAKHYDKQTPPDTALLCRPLKMVVYINQNGCEDCKLRALLPIYMFILENRHLENFGVIIILNTSDMEATDNTLKDIRFRRTVFYDSDGSFERLNPHLPVNKQFHAFLLNEENKVILAGNPVHNEKLKKLYLAELNKKLF